MVMTFAITMSTANNGTARCSPSMGASLDSHSCYPRFSAQHMCAGMPNGAECLMLKPGMEMIASRFETRRYLALLGGTTEFTKWEGLTFAPDHGTLCTIIVA